MVELASPPSQPTTSPHTISPDIPIHPARPQDARDERPCLMGRVLGYVGGGRRSKNAKLDKSRCAQPEPWTRMGRILEQTVSNGWSSATFQGTPAILADLEVQVSAMNEVKASLGSSSPSDPSPSHAKRDRLSSGSHYLDSPPVYSVTAETACTPLPSIALKAPCQPQHMSLGRILRPLPPLPTPLSSHPQVCFELEHAKTGDCGSVPPLLVPDTPQQISTRHSPRFRPIPQTQQVPHGQHQMAHDRQIRDVALYARSVSTSTIVGHSTGSNERIKVALVFPDSLGDKQDHPGSTSNSSYQLVFHNTLQVLCSEALATAFAPSSTWVRLQQYARELALLDCISSLIHSREYREKLFALAESLGVTGNPMFRRAVQQDESVIAEVLRCMTTSKIHRQSLLALEGGDAQKFVDVGQEVLDRGLLVCNEDSSMVLGLLIRLCERCHKLPTSIVLHGVTDVNTVPTFSGGFGDLFRATHDGNTVALKKLRIFNRNRTGDAKIRKRFCQEALLWHGLKHPHIVPFLGVDIESFPSSFCLVSPWMRHGTVLDHLKDCGRSNINKTIFEIIHGLLYLHSRKIIHGDLRGANILVNDQWEACLTDFGLTVFSDPAATVHSSQHDGSIRWMAPELHDPKSFGLSEFRLTPQTDIYSFACVCLELYTGLPPFPNLKLDTAVLLAVLAGGRPKRPYAPIAFPDEMWTIVECCWCPLPSDRMSTQAVANAMHRFLSSPTAVGGAFASVRSQVLANTF